MLVYSGLAVVGELGSDEAYIFWLLLLMVWCLPFTIWISLVFVDLGGYMESALRAIKNQDHFSHLYY